jgi:LPXTG-site transpeptidase (sortase) family protein
MHTTRNSRILRIGEWACYGLGSVLCVFFAAQLAQGEMQREAGIASFEQAQQPSGAALPEGLPLSLAELGEPDTSLWSPGRVEDYRLSLEGEIPPVLGVLELPSVGLKVPVYPSDSELNMDRGAGVIDGMAYPHEGGNIGIAGHRDGYFRALKDVQVGDPVILQTLEGPKRFVIDSRRVVEIDDTDLLQDTDDQRVTLVTCYPFYFVGHAPQRFIVTASLDNTYVRQ